MLLKLAIAAVVLPGFISIPLHASNDAETHSKVEIRELEADTYRTTPSEELTSKIWKSTVGHGIRAGVRHVGVDVGPALGMEILGGTQEHDFALMRFQYGLMLDGAFQPEGSTLGNWEIMGELFAGSQFQPEGAYLFGVAPVLRYHFNTGTRWVPFVDVGAGFSATDIGQPDLRTVFEFTVQGGAGFNYFLWDDTAITAQYRFLHLSNGGLKRPNLGSTPMSSMWGCTTSFEIARGELDHPCACDRGLDSEKRETPFHFPVISTDQISISGS